MTEFNANKVSLEMTQGIGQNLLGNHRESSSVISQARVRLIESLRKMSEVELTRCQEILLTAVEEKQNHHDISDALYTVIRQTQTDKESFISKWSTALCMTSSVLNNNAARKVIFALPVGNSRFVLRKFGETL